jgi:carboxyl-terminal processing protease
VLNAVKAGYVEPVDDKKLITHAISGMLSNLDPHSTYLDAGMHSRIFRSPRKANSAAWASKSAWKTVSSKSSRRLEDSPAFRAGIKSGDLIIKLDDDTSTKGMTLWAMQSSACAASPIPASRLTIAAQG